MCDDAVQKMWDDEPSGSEILCRVRHLFHVFMPSLWYGRPTQQQVLQRMWHPAHTTV
jgi:hypothetical protein